MTAPKKFKNMRVSVLGAGSSGLAAIDVLFAQEAKVFLSESQSLEKKTKRKLDALGIRYEQGGHTACALEADVVVVSPGISENPILLEAQAANLPIWSELELGYRLCPSQNIVAVTGTNGKSTTTQLIGKLLETHNYQVALGGNLGPPFCSLLEGITSNTWVVLEVSSFQLEHVSSFKPHIGVWLNLAPDHLDRHQSMMRYRALKRKLFARQTEGDHAVLGPGLCLEQSHKAQQHTFTPLPASGSFSTCSEHHREDLAAALYSARLVDKRCSLDAIDWHAVLHRPHCLEFVDKVHSVSFYNDSKATNPHATQAALETLKNQAPLCVILGGCPKGTQPNALAQYLADHPHVAQAILVGPFAPWWEQALLQTGFFNFSLADTLETAVQSLNSNIRTCVLSPAGASFDQFPNYQARGEAFKTAVKALKQSSH